MNLQRCMLAAYAALLRFYPAPFREHFGQEMLQVAEESGSSDWPFIFGDTAVGVVRCWIEGTRSKASVEQPNAYVAVGGSGVNAFRLVPGVVLSVLIVAGVFYASLGRPVPCSKSVKAVISLSPSAQRTSPSERHNASNDRPNDRQSNYQ